MISKYLDSTVFLYALLEQGPRSRRAADILRAVAAGEQEAATASLTVDEVLYKLLRKGLRETALETMSALLSMADLRLLPIGREEVRLSLDLLGRYDHLHPRDAIHAAAAKAAGIQTVVSDDVDFDEIDGIRREPLG